jgi:hypothetical protein
MISLLMKNRKGMNPIMLNLKRFTQSQKAMPMTALMCARVLNK